MAHVNDKIGASWATAPRPTLTSRAWPGRAGGPWGLAGRRQGGGGRSSGRGERSSDELGAV